MPRNKSRQALHHPPMGWVADQHTATSQRYPDVYQELNPGKLLSFEQANDNTLLILSKNSIKIRIQVWADRIWRVSYARENFKQQTSYALSPDFKAKSVTLSVEETKGQLKISSDTLVCKVDKKSCLISFYTRKGNKKILKEATPYMERSSILTGTHHLQLSFETQTKEVFYGLGDKSWDLNLRGQNFVNWNSDAFGYNKERDPLYRTIPFYYGVNKEHAYGLFLHNSGRSHFDFDSQKESVTRIWSEVGEMDYFFCYGPNLDEVAQQYHSMTGKPELPPLWALGFHQCRWSYYPEARVRKLAETFRDLKIPCDAIYLDIDYMDGYRCFTVNKEYFPQLGNMIRDLEQDGFQTVVMIDPGIKVDEDYHVYQQGIEKDYFCRRSTGELMVGPVWPPECVWPDYTRQDVREWWGELYRGLYEEDSVSGFWNDMNEPAVFKVNSLTFPDHVMHDQDGHPTDHREVHNVYGMLMSQGTYEGLKAIKPEKRPFVLTRATFSGGQRFAAVWTGDNVASWDHLRLANRQCQRLSISGFSLVGTDIGGFVDQPSPELLIRWLQLGIFHPVFRVHSMGNNIDGAAEADAEQIKLSEAELRLDQEPWVFGEPYTSLAREAIEFRYQLLPYLYTSVYENVTSGIPVIRSLAFVDQANEKSLSRENEFMLGQHLLVSPVTREKAKIQYTYLPSGTWYDYYTGVAHEGQSMRRQGVKINTIPLFVRAGGIIPIYPVQQYTNELNISEVELRAYYGKQEVSSQFYHDKGEGYDYQKEDFGLHSFTTKSTDSSYTIAQKIKGKYRGNLEVFEIKIFGLPFQPETLHIDGEQINIIDKEGSAYVVVVPADFKEMVLGR
ncbi:MAG: TIM-barrel domain-containing protein [Bacteroidota bacterium]